MGNAPSDLVESWTWLVQTSVKDYIFSFLASGVMVAARAIGLWRIRRRARGLLRAEPLHPLAFYWPVYAWGLEAVRSLQYWLATGCSWQRGVVRLSSVVYGWNYIYASVIALANVLIICAAMQATIGTVRAPDRAVAVSLPFPAAAAILNVYLLNSALLLVFAMDGLK